MPPRPRCSKITRAGCWAKVAALAGTLLVAQALCRADDAPNAEPLPFSKAIEMALEHSGILGIATINQWRAHEAYQELRSNYIPQLTIGSGLGYSYGFPLTLEGSAPSLVNFTSSSQDMQDKRSAVILDTALTYAQLDQLTGKIKTLTEAQSAADKAEFV